MKKLTVSYQANQALGDYYTPAWDSLAALEVVTDRSGPLRVLEPEKVDNQHSLWRLNIQIKDKPLKDPLMKK